MSKGLERVLLKALEKDPERRYASARELGDDLRRLETGLAVTAPRPRRARALRLALASLVAVMAVLAGVIAGNVGRSKEWLFGTGGVSSLAVLPLDNLSGDPEKEYVADGVTEALITNVGKIGTLRVIARPSVMRFKGSDTPLSEIAEALGVRALVVGSVLPIGDRIRIAAQLIDPVDGRLLWGDDYERDLSDILIVQSEIARTIAAELGARLAPEEAAALARARTVDPEAHDLYLKGRYHLAQFTPDGMYRAIEHFEQAVALDPYHAGARAGLGFGYAMLNQPFKLMRPEEAMPLATKWLTEALEIDNTLAEAHAYLCIVKLIWEWDWTGAERAAKRALALDPSFAFARNAHAWYLAFVGRHEEAIREAKRGAELDPLSPFQIVQLANVLEVARRYDEALEECGRALELDPNFRNAHLMMSLIYHKQGRYAQAVDAEVRTLILGGAGADEAAAHREEYESAIDEDSERGYWQWRRTLAEKNIQTGSCPLASPCTLTDLASIRAGLGDVDVAIELLERAYEEREAGLSWLRVGSAFDPLRSDPRFEALLSRMNFPPG